MTIKHQWLKKPHIKTEDFVRMYNEGLSSEQIAKQFGIVKSSVSKRLKKSGIVLRKSGDYKGKGRYWLWKGENHIDSVTRKYNQRMLRKWSKAVRDRDDNQCTRCHEFHRRLHAHHIIPIEKVMNSIIEFDISNGITLCPKCHKATHKEIMY